MAVGKGRYGTGVDIDRGRLRAIRKKKGFSLRGLGGERLTGAVIQQYESGRCRPSADSLSYLAERLGEQPSYFLQEPAAAAEAIPVGTRSAPTTPVAVDEVIRAAAVRISQQILRSSRLSPAEREMLVVSVSSLHILAATIAGIRCDFEGDEAMRPSRGRGSGLAIDGVHLRIERERLKLSLAEMAGGRMSKAAVAQYETGAARPSYGALAHLAGRLGKLPEEFLIGGAVPEVATAISAADLVSSAVTELARKRWEWGSQLSADEVEALSSGAAFLRSLSRTLTALGKEFAQA